MSIGDVSGLIDLATAPDTTPAAPTEETVASTPETDQALDSIDVSSEEGTNPSDDATQPTDGDAERSVDARTNPAAVRAALKALRDSDPKLAPIARQLNDAFGRYNAYKNVFPKVADAQSAKALLDAVGGADGFTSLQENVKAIQATDAKLYAGDPTVLDDIIEDMRSEGKIDAFGKLASPFLEKLRATDEKAYFAAMKPHFYQGLRDVGLPNVVESLMESLAGDQPNVANAKAILGNMQKWFEDLKAGVDSASKQNLDPERQAFEKERTEFRSQQQKEFQSGVATSCDKYNNDSLGAALRPYLKDPFFSGWSKESLHDLGAAVKQQLYSELSQNKAYQTQMDAFFSQKSPDKTKIQNFHNQTVDSIAKRLVKEVLDRRYPNRTKGKAAPVAKKAAPAPQTTGADGKFQFQYVPTKPKFEDIDWSEPGAQAAYIAGKAKLRGSNRYVSWNARDRK
jgi:hypothetical protein